LSSFRSSVGRLDHIGSFGPALFLRRRPNARARTACPLLLCAISLLGSAPHLAGQEATSELFAGDSVRVDGVLVGRVLRVEGSTATVLSREKPKCRAGEGHGDAPICDPAPVIRRDIDLRYSTVERRMQKGNVTKRTAVGGVLGAVAFGALGYVVGPSIGFGKVDGCVPVPGSAIPCDPDDVVPADELEARQKQSDQRRGALFFGVVGGTASAILARKLSTGWVRFEPALPVGEGEPWGLTVVIPGVR
jgi:hypothetical protein